MATYGPYKRNSDGRWIIIVDGITISYPKYLYEKHHGVKVSEPWTVDHIDENPDNNSIDNLQLLTRSDNAKKSSRGKSYNAGIPLSKEHKANLSGYCNGKSKIPFGMVEYYRKLYESKQISKMDIVRKTKLSRRTVENFLNYRSYK